MPELRFSTFGGEWNQHKLGDLCDEFRSGKSIKAKDIQNEGRYPVLGGNGLRGYTNTYNHDGVYALIGRQGALCGNMNISYGKAYFTEHAIAVKGNENNDTRFLFYLLGKMNLGQYSGQSAQPGLAVNKLIELTASTPNHAEQTKISEFFTQLDETISLHQQELDTLKQTKQGFLQKMFPNEGESIPQFRFSSFNEKWKEHKLGELGNTFTGLSGKTKEDFGHGSAEFVTYMNVFRNPISDIKMTENVEVDPKQNELQFGDVLFTTSSETPHEVGMSSVWLDNRKNVYLNSFCFGYRPIANINPLFLAYSLRSKSIRKQLMLLAQGISRYNISKTKAMEILVKLPSVEEQIKIGNFFKQLDDVIALHQQELDALKQTKKAFLQKMFV